MARSTNISENDILSLDNPQRWYTGTPPEQLTYGKLINEWLNPSWRNGQLARRSGCFELLLPDDTRQSSLGRPSVFSLDRTLCFGDQTGEFIEFEPAALLEFAECHKSADTLVAFARKWGPLDFELKEYHMGLMTFEKFMSNIQKKISQLDHDPELCERVRLRAEQDLDTLKASTLGNLWMRDRLERLVGESVSTWVTYSWFFDELLSLHRAATDSDPNTLNSILQLPLSFQGFKSLSTARESNSGISEQIRQHFEQNPENFERAQGDPAAAARLFLQSQVNRHLEDNVHTFVTDDGFKNVPRNLFTQLWLQLGDFIHTNPEHFKCMACGKWNIVTGKARGRGKKTCGHSCRVRLSQKKRHHSRPAQPPLMSEIETLAKRSRPPQE